MIKEIPFPFSFTLFGRTGVSTYSIMLMLAFLTASYLIPRELKRRGLKPEVSDWIILLAVAGAIVGSKIGFVFEIWNEIWLPGRPEGFFDKLSQILFHYRGMADRYPGESTGLWEALFSGGGLVFYGGLAVTFAVLYAYLRYNRLEVWRYGDAFMPSLAVGYAIGRLGCLISGDGCFGYAASVNIPVLTMVYGSGAVMNSAGVNVWNTPVIESIASTVLFLFFMYWMRFKNFRPGMMTAVFLIFNGVARFLVEFLRINDAAIPILPPPTISVAGHDVPLTYALASAEHQEPLYFLNWHWYGFTQSQIVAVVMLLIGVAWIITGRLYQQDTGASAHESGKKKRKK